MLKGLTKGNTSETVRAVDMRLVGWDVVYFLLGTMGRTLTVSGIARRTLAALQRAEAAVKGDNPAIVPSLQSFRTLIEMKIGDQAAALETSRRLSLEYPDHILVAQRHTLNLRTAGELEQSAVSAINLVEMSPETPCYHGLLGDILFEQKDFKGALKCYQTANPGKVNYPIFALRQANLLRRAKRL